MSLKVIAGALIASMTLVLLAMLAGIWALWFGYQRMVVIEDALTGQQKDWEQRQPLTESVDRLTEMVEGSTAEQAVLKRQVEAFVEISGRTLTVVEGVKSRQDARGGRIAREEKATEGFKSKDKEHDKAIAGIQTRLSSLENQMANRPKDKPPRKGVFGK